jgi:hypothetical protein
MTLLCADETAVTLVYMHPFMKRKETHGIKNSPVSPASMLVEVNLCKGLKGKCSSRQ